jgi:hypothetical protein
VPSEVTLGFSVTHDEMASFMKALTAMQAKSVLAGFPAGDEEREATKVENGKVVMDGTPAGITNAALAYIHNTGEPEKNIPARPFMVEGIETKADDIADGMEQVGIAALDGNVQAVDVGLHTVGTIARDAIKGKIIDGPFEPLAESTLKNYARQGVKGAQEELDSRAAGNDPNPENVRPLNRSGQLRGAVQYVLQDN